MTHLRFYTLQRPSGHIATVDWEDGVALLLFASRTSAESFIEADEELSDFHVFRGSSGTRRAGWVMRSMIEHMRGQPDVLYGITVDGPRGPRFKANVGVAKIASACRAPVYVSVVAFSSRISVPTWDRTASVQRPRRSTTWLGRLSTAAMI